MVIHFENAYTTHATVVSSIRFNCGTFLAESDHCRIIRLKLHNTTE